jgi:hypothetical protein
MRMLAATLRAAGRPAAAAEYERQALVIFRELGEPDAGQWTPQPRVSPIDVFRG